MRGDRLPRVARLCIAALAAIAIGGVGLAGRQPAAAPLTSIEVMIPMRDGTRLFTQIQVQSTWFPVIDRNPQTFVSNVFLAQPADFNPATQRIFRSGAQASHILLPVAAR